MFSVLIKRLEVRDLMLKIVVMSGWKVLGIFILLIMLFERIKLNLSEQVGK